jgi:hypothetical protein
MEARSRKPGDRGQNEMGSTVENPCAEWLQYLVLHIAVGSLDVLSSSEPHGESFANAFCSENARGRAAQSQQPRCSS